MRQKRKIEPQHQNPGNEQWIEWLQQQNKQRQQEREDERKVRWLKQAALKSKMGNWGHYIQNMDEIDTEGADDG